MKKILLVLLAICTVSCSKDDNTADKIGRGIFERNLKLAESLVGTHNVIIYNNIDINKEFTTIDIQKHESNWWSRYTYYSFTWNDIVFKLDGIYKEPEKNEEFFVPHISLSGYYQTGESRDRYKISIKGTFNQYHLNITINEVTSFPYYDNHQDVWHTIDSVD